MPRRQFQVLYRQFLFRVVDVELLSRHAHGDAGKLVAQFGALLAFVSFWRGLYAFPFAGLLPRDAPMEATWGEAHSLISMSMLVVGLFAVMSWDSAFPDRHDLLILSPLPVRPVTLFTAKIAALASMMGVTVVAMNLFTGLSWPMVFAPAPAGLLGWLRSMLAYWLTMIGSGACVVGAVLGVQGLTAHVLPRRYFLRVSGALQIAAFGFFLGTFVLEPFLVRPAVMASNPELYAWWPSFWFLGLFEQLNGSMHPTLAPLAARAWIALGVTVCGTGAVLALAYFRTLKKIVEEPDIVPAARGLRWVPRFGNALQSAVVLFSARSLLRSRKHRVILALYLGVAVAWAWVGGRLRQFGTGDWHQPSLSFVAASFMLLVCAVIGMRAVFAMPLDLRANWIFQMTSTSGTAHASAARRSLLVLAVAPVLVVCAVVLFALWPWIEAAEHLAVVALLGYILTELCILGFHKIPFTCSYLPGRSRWHFTILGLVLFMPLAVRGTAYELQALGDPAAFVSMAAILAAVAVAVRWWGRARAAESELRFEEADEPVIRVLDLQRDGHPLR